MRSSTLIDRILVRSTTRYNRAAAGGNRRTIRLNWKLMKSQGTDYKSAPARGQQGWPQYNHIIYGIILID